MDGSGAMQRLQLLVEGCSSPAGSEAAAQMLVSTPTPAATARRTAAAACAAAAPLTQCTPAT